ncbi:glycine--tRNA ligase subunit beta [Caldifermentibacillus hisashii]|uniref:glycine--tRNA ligase subunit beta n=1 Tax=Caldifermentibacillus hisashii TaxID=996558 RepID=UPI002DFDE59D|nr:glycine--tRNA ligase subunit beta [Caldifermentibacillus hisashii]MEC5270621.1 glycine--tRNA ligase subunit beta [Caldifermentibacillus hisashii]
MNKSDLLLEIGLEEIPARFVLDAANQLADRVRELLTEQHIGFGKIHVYSTPRRLAVLVEEVNEKQDDLHEEVKGPAKKIALDENGNWTKAAAGFTRGQGKTVDDIYFKEIDGTEYVHVAKHIQGRNTMDVLINLKEVITGLSFPKNMRWADFDLRYIRPIRWIIALYGSQILPIEITNVKASNKTYGHRFLGQEIVIREPKEYKTVLLAQHVMVDYEERKAMILEQIHQLENEKNWHVPIDPDLLDEVSNLVEYPTVLFGSFEKEYLQLPEEVLITTMKEHQRYFPVKDESGRLLNYFITVRNGDANHLDNVRRGNEKVIRARLQDAVFFYEEDQKLSINDAINKLEKVVYHDQIGTYKEKLQRIKSLSQYILQQLPVSKEMQEHTLRAAEICKFDLVTQMVDEFPELQGIMGEKYAVIHGENPLVAKAINEHYMPKNADGELPETEAGAVVSIADKLDTIASIFSIGLIPSGSQDPYSLRRQATGVVQILANKGWNIDFTALLKESIKQTVKFSKRNEQEVFADMFSFFQLRFKHLLAEKGIRYDIVDAVLEAPIRDVKSLIEKAAILDHKKEEAGFKENVEALSRVINITKKFEEAIEIDPGLFENETESQLYEAYQQMKSQLYETDPEQYYQLLVRLKNPINQFFDQTMVMVDAEQIRNNRLSLLKSLSNLIGGFAQFSMIIVK